MTRAAIIWAQLAHVALNDADAILYGFPPPTESERTEADHLRALANEWMDRAEALGVVFSGTSHVFTDADRPKS
jgi:hypothetical protein